MSNFEGFEVIRFQEKFCDVSVEFGIEEINVIVDCVD